MLSHSPGGELLHRVVPLTQVGEVPEGSGAALRVVDGVVDLAADRGPSASGEPAVLVAGAEKSALRLCGAVPIDGDHGPVDGVGEDPGERGRVCGESAGGVGVDRGTSDEVGGSVVGVEQGECGDDDLNLRTDRAQGPGPRAGRRPRWGRGSGCR